MIFETTTRNRVSGRFNNSCGTKSMINGSFWCQIMDFKTKRVDKPTRWRCDALVALKKGMASKGTKKGCCAKMWWVVGGKTVRWRKRKELWKTKLACFSSNGHFSRFRVNSSHTAMTAGREKRHRKKSLSCMAATCASWGKAAMASELPLAVQDFVAQETTWEISEISSHYQFQVRLLKKQALFDFLVLGHMKGWVCLGSLYL